MTDNTHRISKLETQSQIFSKDIHEIKTDVHDIKKDVADGKKVTDMNTQEIKKTNKIQNDMLILHTEAFAMFKGGWRVFTTGCKIIGGLVVFALGLYFSWKGLK